MESTELNRVQSDIDLIKATIGSEFPYGRHHVWQCLIVAGAGLIIGLMAVPDWRAFMRMALVAYFFGVLVHWFWGIAQIRAERTERPRAWSWTRRETGASLLGMGLLIPYIFMIRLLVAQREEWGFLAWRDYVAGPILFFVGVAVSCVGITARERIYWLGWGIPAILGGLITPWCQSNSQTSLVLGAVMTIGGLISAAILHWQIRESEITHVAD